MKKYYLFLIFAVFGFLAAGLIFFNTKVSAVDQIKSTEFFVASNPNQISSVTSSQFSIYIGDNLSGVTNPVKSAYFIVSGVYTGSGSIELKIDNDGATAKVFALPDIAAVPTPFEIIYKDDTNKINPASAGSYTYTLNIIPSGVTVSGLGAKLNLTHRFAPPSCPDGQPSNEKIKTTEFFVTSATSTITSSTSTPFSIYIGDNLSGVTNPVKSAYFTVFGVYTSTAEGSLELKIDGDSATAKIFILPNVGSTPTPFEIIYKDDTNKINPASAGSYDYTLNISPANMTISGLGAKATISHRYKPPTCGTGYYPTGEVISMVFDTGTDGAAYNSIMWKGSLGSGTGKIRFQLATSNSDVGPWTYIGGASCNSGDWYSTGGPNLPVEITCAPQNHNNQRYFRYKIQICSDNCSASGLITPIVDDAVVSWSP